MNFVWEVCLFVRKCRTSWRVIKQPLPPVSNSPLAVLASGMSSWTLIRQKTMGTRLWVLSRLIGERWLCLFNILCSIYWSWFVLWFMHLSSESKKPLRSCNVSSWCLNDGCDGSYWKNSSEFSKLGKYKFSRSLSKFLGEVCSRSQLESSSERSLSSILNWLNSP